ncbi:MAG TPA: cysteine--tRNA ligase [Dehalococcoidia bacterium]|nr:cysteine--tRNA ligase [Dehalococcoidia bacterium]
MKVFNTLSGKKEEFLPRGDEVRMYVCGVTPYDDAHIGHAMSYIIFDVVRRYLQFRGYKVKYVQNVTDIDDKLIDRSNQGGVPVRELAERYTRRYFEDMEALNVAPADIYPRATEEIPKILEVIQGLVDNGYAYPAGGSVYFRVRNASDYGKLAHRSLDSMVAGEGATGSEEKEDPMDFVLWKAAKPGEPSWPSPWGKGRPGWHIECSAMSLKYLGDTLDIHGGGQDLIFPHHENEIVQSESFTGKKPFVKYWLHNGLVQLGEEKMSKSLGNLITIREALEKFSPDAIRIFVLGSHYRSPLTYSEEIIRAAERGAERLTGAVQSAGNGERGESPLEAASYRQRFIEAMDDDFNTAQALAALFDLAREINRLRDETHNASAGQQLLAELSGVLGLTLKPPERSTLDIKPFIHLWESIDRQLTEAAPEQLSDDIVINLIRDRLKGTTLDSAEAYIRLLISIREQVRQAKEWLFADKIRKGLEGLGITLEDTPRGTIWKYKR